MVRSPATARTKCPRALKTAPIPKAPGSACDPAMTCCHELGLNGCGGPPETSACPGAGSGPTRTR